MTAIIVQRLHCTALACLLLLFPALSSQAARREVLASFAIGPRNPDRARLCPGPDAAWYGVTPFGGGQGKGCLYRVTADGSYTTVIQFKGTLGEPWGSQPFASLVTGPDGHLYGTTFSGGQSDRGTVFRLKFDGPSPVIETLVHFTGPTGAAKGGQPLGELIFDASGTMWGTTQLGGAGEFGSVFKRTSAGVFTAVVDFTNLAGLKPGNGPVAGLTPDGNGAFLGTTAGGGAGDFGVLFRLTSAGVYSVLGAFTGTGGAQPGASPQGTLWREPSDGLFYGTTLQGGTDDKGTVFRVAADGTGFTTLASFTGTAGSLKGTAPGTCVTPDGSGRLLSVTSAGGEHDAGTIFAVTPATATVQNLVDLTGGAADSPQAPLLRLNDGSWLGTTSGGGSTAGTVFRYSEPGGLPDLMILTRFNGTSTPVMPRAPANGLVKIGSVLYGATTGGGTEDLGTLFKISGGTAETIISFTGIGGSAKGSRPNAGLNVTPSGLLMGSTFSGGQDDLGTLFSYDPATGILETLAEFGGTVDGRLGSRPAALLTPESDGSWVGTVQSGGVAGFGLTFRLRPDRTLESVIEFSGPQSGSAGSLASSPLLPDGAGGYYGTTRQGGLSNNNGALFRQMADGSYTPLAYFTGTGGSNPGSNPNGELAIDRSGRVVGTTRSGGSTNLGTIFRYNPNGSLQTAASFTGTGGALRGSQPQSGLTPEGGGGFVGMTTFGGSSNNGTIFRLPPQGAAVNLLEFTGRTGTLPGSNPVNGNLRRESDGWYYGTTQAGGEDGGGVVFRVWLGPEILEASHTSTDATTASFSANILPEGQTTSVKVEWGITPALGQTSAVLATVPAGTDPVMITPVWTGLEPAFTYYARLTAENASGMHFSEVFEVKTATLPEAEIAVFDGGSILSPQRIDNEGDPLDFGSSFATVDVTRMITILNQGGTDLVLSQILTPAGFSAVPPSALPLTILPGETAVISVALDSDEGGFFSGNLELTTNDADEPVFGLALSGTAEALPPGSLMQPEILSTGISSLLTFGGVPGMTYIIESSPDLATWTRTGPDILVGPDGIVVFEDTILPRPDRIFYRMTRLE